MFSIMFRKKDSLTGNCNGNNRGFTLIELTIVLVVAGLLFVGLWRLLASGNQQVRDQNAANQQEQLISGIKSYLASSENCAVAPCTSAGSGLAFLTNTLASTGGTTPLGLPSSQANAAGTTGCPTDGNMANDPGLCSYLPPGFWSSTPNSYGQTYGIRVERNDGSANGTTPTSYSFMIMTTGGETIPDTSGGRIAGFIGNDGGFIYNSNVCNATFASWACGTYGTWSSAVTTYGFTAPATGGYIASRTYISPSSDNTSPWLERNTQIPGDPSFVWNTMTTDLYMGGATQQPVGGPAATDANIYLLPPGTTPATILGVNKAGSINLGSPTGGGTAGTLNAMGGTINMNTAATTTGGGTMNVDGGIINMQNGTINMNAAGSTTGGGTINLVNGQITGSGTVGGGNSQIDLSSSAGTTQPLINLAGNLNQGVQEVMNVGNGCNITSVNFGTTEKTAPLCFYSLHTDNLSASGLVFANTFVANTFIYTNGAAVSDMRMKKDIRPLESPLDDVMKLKPVSFAYKSNDKQSLGVLAQDVEKVYPQLVVDGQEHMKAVNYDGLIAPLIGAVQELKKQNDELRQELKIQKEREQLFESSLKNKNSD